MHSDATLIITAPDVDSPGTELTKAYALRHGKACRVSDGTDPTAVAAWIRALGANIRLNVAGPRATERAGGYDTCHCLLSNILLHRRRQAQPDNSLTTASLTTDDRPGRSMSASMPCSAGT